MKLLCCVFEKIGRSIFTVFLMQTMVKKHLKQDLLGLVATCRPEITWLLHSVNYLKVSDMIPDLLKCKKGLSPGSY